MTGQERYRFCLDRVAFAGGIEVDGWAFDEVHGACRIRLLADGQSPEGERGRFGLPRGDVALAFANPAAERCGFRVAARLPAGTRNVGLVFDGPGGSGWLPLLERTGPGPRDWRVLASPAPSEPEYAFLTGRGAGFAQVLGGGGRLGRALAAFGGASPPHPARPVSIVVPVYGGKAYLHALARTLLERTDHRHPVILVDDGNADRTVSAFLVALRTAHDHITLLQMPGNSGYLAAATAGVIQALRVNPAGHVILLNSDVEVPEGWVERLVAPLDASATVASATPFTNAGTICGFPAMPGDNPAFLGAGVEAIDPVFASLVAPPIEVPTGVGFCMAFSRQVIGDIGFFDAAAFGRGYGEEVDWCRRALARGYVNVLVPNLYVHHKHGGSFDAAEKTASIERSGAVIRDRYPSFDAEVQDFIAADPAAPLRAAAMVRLWTRLGGSGAVLVFDHGDSGGAVIVRQREIARRLEEGRLVALIRPTAVTRPDMPEAAVDIELRHRSATFHLPAQDLGDVEALAQSLPLAEILVNSLVGFETLGAVLAFIAAQKRMRNTPIRVLHNDYFPVCPSLNLIDAEDRFCDVPSAERCAACLPCNRHARREGAAALDLIAHRRTWGELIALADRHVFFSRAALAVMRKAFAIPDERTLVLPHLAEHATVAPMPLHRPADGVLRVAVPGGINVAKGAAIVVDMVRLLAERRLPMIIELFGNIDRTIDSPHFHDNGPYGPGELARLIAERGCGAVFLPSIWPETHCYVFDEVIGLGVPVVVFDLGAPAERIGPWPNGITVRPFTAEAALDAILQAIHR